MAAEGAAGREVRQIDIEGMTCAACVQRVEKVLKRVPGVSDATVNLATRRATIDIDRQVTDAALVSAVERAGYAAKPHKTQSLSDAAPSSDEARRVVIAAALSVPLMVVAMVPAAQFTGHGWAQLGLALAVLLGPGLGLSRAAVKSARHGEATMDTLVALGAWAAVGVSVPALLANPGHVGHGHYWFETAGMIVTFVLLGRWIESRARRRTGDALRALAELRPATARRVTASGDDEEVSVDALRLGDRVRVGAHQRVPVDGVVRAGRSHVDASLVTGESLPVSVGEGAEVVGGTVNHEGA
ncbi:MAG: cation transporter, partial [Polyangiales bacterium]